MSNNNNEELINLLQSINARLENIEKQTEENTKVATTMVNYVMDAGSDVSGALNPAPLYDTRVEAYMPGNNFTNNDPFREFYRAEVSAGTFTVKNLPDGNYDFIAGDGPSMWNPENVTVPSGFVIISGPDPITFIAGIKLVLP